MPDLDPADFAPWERVVPPFWWPRARMHVVADRIRPDGVRQHMVKGSVPKGLMIANAEIIGEDDVPGTQYSAKLSHISTSAV